jgi:hypothetical protein
MNRGFGTNVRKTKIGPNLWLVSTVFLGLDHGHGGGPPVLWETMIFAHGQEFDQDQDRYTSHEDAVRGHHETVNRVRAAYAAQKENP